MKQKHWILIFAAVIAVCLAWAAAARRRADGACLSGRNFIIQLEPAAEPDADRDRPAGENIITVADGEVFVSHADCPDQICVQHGPLQKTGGPIICLPNRLTIEWAQKDAQVDALSGTGGLP